MNACAHPWLLCAIFHLVCSSGIAAEPELVGNLGSPSQLVFSGANSFKPETLRRALSLDIDFHLAAHPFAPLDAYLKTIESHLWHGYLNAGFPHARVTAKVQADGIAVTINEGSRFRAGKVVITGTRHVDPDHLLRWLTQTNVAGSNIICGTWHSGAYLSCTPFLLKVLRMTLTNAFRAAGFPEPQISLEMDLDRAARIGNLNVNVIDEGPRPKLGRIEIRGAVRNSRADILKLLELTPKTKLDPDLPARVEQRLHDSARFVKAAAVLGPTGSDQKAPLLITLQELPEGPPLGDKFSPKEKASLRFREWLLNNFGRTVDGFLTFEPGEIFSDRKVQMILSRDGVLVALRRGHEPAGFEYALVARPEGFGFYSGSLKRKLAGPMGGGVIIPSLGLSFADDPTERFNLSLGAKVESHGTGAPIQFNLDLPPAIFVAMLYDPTVRSRVAKGVLSLESPAGSLKTDARSGRLLDARLSGTNALNLMQFSIGEGIYRETVAAIEAQASDWPNMRQPERPLSSAMAMLVEEALRSPLLANSNAASLQRLHGFLVAAERISLPQILEPVNRFFTDFQTDTNETFSIMIDPFAITGPAALLAGLGISRAEAVFQKGSWPWTLAREACFVAAERGKYTEDELNRLLKLDQTGAVGCLISTLLVTKADSSAARTFAIAGLTRLSGQEFLQDLEALFGGDTIVAQCFRRLCDELAKLSDEHIDAIASVLPDSEAKLLRESRRLLRTPQAKSLVENLTPALEVYWEDSLKEQIRTHLRNLIAPRRSSPQQARANGAIDPPLTIP